LVHAMESNEVTNEEPTKKKSKAKAKAEEPETKELEVGEAPVEEVPEEKQPTLEEVRAAMADKSRDGHREAVKAIITKYGANNLSSLDPKHYAAALKEVGELK